MPITALPIPKVCCQVLLHLAGLGCSAQHVQALREEPVLQYLQAQE